MRQFKFYSDAGHGWLAVKLDLLDALKLTDRISRCSYMKGRTVYLEEDADATLFAKEYQRLIGSFETKVSHYDRSPIRGYEIYDVDKAKDIINKKYDTKRF